MAQLIIVGMFLVGLCAFVWTLIAQEAPSAAGFGPPLTRRLHGLHPWHRLRGIDVPKLTADTAERLWATARTLALRVRAAASRPRIRFSEALDTTAPMDAAPAAGPGRVHSGGGRVVAALELVVLIAVVGGIVAAVVLGTGHILMKSLGGHFHSS
jgi:hypothetical protein